MIDDHIDWCIRIYKGCISQRQPRRWCRWSEGPRVWCQWELFYSSTTFYFWLFWHCPSRPVIDWPWFRFSGPESLSSLLSRSPCPCSSKIVLRVLSTIFVILIVYRLLKDLDIFSCSSRGLGWIPWANEQLLSFSSRRHNLWKIDLVFFSRSWRLFWFRTKWTKGYVGFNHDQKHKPVLHEGIEAIVLCGILSKSLTEITPP